jgi:hypothetical protein
MSKNFQFSMDHLDTQWPYFWYAPKADLSENYKLLSGSSPESELNDIAKRAGIDPQGAN